MIAAFLTALALSQTQPAVRRSTPLPDDPGMVVRQAGTVPVNCTNCTNLVIADGGYLGTVGQGPGQDGGSWSVYIEGGNLSVTSSATISFDGGSIGYMRMPDGGALEVYVVNSSSTSLTVPDGGLPVNVAGGTVALVGTDVFGAAVMSTRYNQIEVDYSVDDPDSITSITVTKTNGGDAINSGGQAVYSTSTNATGGIKAVTNSTTTYRPHAESYAAFTAIFTLGVVNSYQRIGTYDASNGFYVGYSGTDFGVTIRKAGVDTFTPRASFNVDTLTGAAGSKYTRAGVPETMDPTKDQLYRIRYGWLGAAPISYEILSPDGNWVLFHILRHPNTNAATSINQPDLPITLEAQKSAGATNITISTACWAGGSTSDLVPIASTINDDTLASMARAVITGRSSTGGGTYVNVKVNPSGALTTASSQDTFPWLIAGADGGAVPVTGNWWAGPDGGALGSVSQGPGQDGGAWAVSQAGSWSVAQGLGYDGGTGWGVWVENQVTPWAPDGGSIGSTVVENTQTLSGYLPNPANIYSTGGGTFTFDPTGSLVTRSQTTTDEGAFSDGFQYLAYPLTGTVTMTNGSTAVTGVGTSFTTQVDTDKYIRLNADPLGSGRRIASVESDTALTLESAYGGSSGSGVVVASNWTSIIPDGGSASVDAGTFFVQNSGTSGSIIAVYRALDYGPIDLTFRLAISARNPSEVIEVGLHNAPPPNDDIHALFEFTGVDNTVGFCKTTFAANTLASLTSFTMPNGGTTDTPHLYSVSLTQDRVAFYVDNVQVCTSQYALPGPYQPLLYGLYITETGTTASPATVSGTWAHSSSYNRMDAIVQNSVPAKLQAQVQGPNAVGSPVTSNPLVMGGSDGVGLRVLNVSPQGEPIVIGSLGNNSNPPSTDNIGALTAVATTSAPSYSPGNLVALSVDTSGKLRTTAHQGAAADGGTGWSVWLENPSATWFPDGGSIGSVTVSNVVTVDLRDAGVYVTNFPATQVVSGTVAATQSGTWNVNASIIDGGVYVLNSPTVLQGAGQDGGAWNVSVNNWQYWTPDGGALGSVTVSNFPATQTVNGTVAATQSGTWAVNQGTGLDGGSGWGVWVENQVVPWAPDGGNIGLVSQGPGQDGGAWNVSINNFPATQTVTGTVNANIEFDGGAVTAIQGPGQDGGAWNVSVNNTLYVIILDGGSSGGGTGGTVTQGPGQDGGAWAVYVTNPAGAGSTVNQGLAYDGGTGWGVYIEGGNLSVTSNSWFPDGGSIGYMVMPDGGPLEVALTSGTISIATVGQGAGQDGGAWNVAGTVSIDNFPATQNVAVTGTASTNLAQVNGNTVNTGSGAAGTGTQRVILATDQTVIPINDNGGSITVDGTVAATQSGTWNITNITGTVSLPTGAATSANQTTIGSQTTKINDGTDTALVTAAGALVVDSSGTTQPVSGTVTANQGGTWSVRTQDGAGNALASSTSAPTGTEQALIVRNIPSGTQTVSGTVTANAGTGTFATNMAQYGGVAVGAGNAQYVQPGTGATFTVTQATAANLNATVTGTVAATQSGTWSTRTQDGSGNAIESAVGTTNGANRGLVVRQVLKTATNPLSTSVTCSTTAAALPATALTNRESLCIYNNGTGTIYLGPSGVTTANGFPLARGAAFCDDLGSQVLYCIVAAGTENARVLEQ